MTQKRASGLTTPPRLLADRVGNGPVEIQRLDKTKYFEADRSLVARLISSGCVEGVGPQSGRIAFLRMLPESLTNAIKVLSDIAKDEADEQKFREAHGSIISGASREVFRQPLRNEKGEGQNWVWCHKRCA